MSISTLTKEQLAKLLNGCQYGNEMTRALELEAKAAGLVVVFGASDDLMEFRGAVHDETGAPGTAFIDGKGLLMDREQIGDNDDATLGDYFARRPTAKRITANWRDESPPWTFETDIPHATFEVLEDHEPFCKGIVFALADCAIPAKPRIFEPGDIAELDDDKDVVPHVDLIPQQLRVHFHTAGVSFGLIDPRDLRFAACVPYSKARSLLQDYARSLNETRTAVESFKKKGGRD